MNVPIEWTRTLTGGKNSPCVDREVDEIQIASMLVTRDHAKREKDFARADEIARQVGG